jgi:hypothetical protein
VIAVAAADGDARLDARGLPRLRRGFQFSHGRRRGCQHAIELLIGFGQPPRPGSAPPVGHAADAAATTSPARASQTYHSIGSDLTTVRISTLGGTGAALGSGLRGRAADSRLQRLHPLLHPKQLLVDAVLLQMQFLDSRFQRTGLFVQCGATAAGGAPHSSINCLHSLGPGLSPSSRGSCQRDRRVRLPGGLFDGLRDARFGRRRGNRGGRPAYRCRLPCWFVCRGFAQIAQVWKPQHGACGNFPGVAVWKNLRISGDYLPGQRTLQVTLAREHRRGHARDGILPAAD